MRKNVLGLPFQYQKHPEYFDDPETDGMVDSKNGVIEKILKQRGVRTVLDLTCGTGSQVFFLKNRGYQVTGADFSPDLLKIARKKALLHGFHVDFIDGDMRTLKVGSFDAVITIFNAVGHLTKIDFEKAMKNIHSNLKDGGIYVFDIFNLNAITDEVIDSFAMYTHKKVEESHLHAVQCSTLDKERGLLISYDSCTIQKNRGVPEQFASHFSLQIYSSKELKEMLERNGFEVIALVDIDGSEFLEDTTVSMLTVTRKK